MIKGQRAAETLAIEVLGWLAGREDLLGVFMGTTGASAQDLRERAQDPGFLGSVLDFLMMDDGWIMAFCEDRGHPYEAPMQARQTLPGGQNIHWT